MDLIRRRSLIVGPVQRAQPLAELAHGDVGHEVVLSGVEACEAATERLDGLLWDGHAAARFRPLAMAEMPEMDMS